MTIPKAGAKVRASDWSSAFPTDTDAWTSYIPTLTQGATVTNTVVYAKYIKIGRLVIFSISLSVTGAGTASNAVLFGLPVAASSSSGIALGSGIIFDVSAGLIYAGIPDLQTASTALAWPASTDGNASGLGARVFTAALASGDVVRFSGMYESAS